MRCGLKSLPACRDHSKKLDGTPAAVACSQCWMGWRPRGLLFAACVLRYSLWSCKVLIILLLQHRGISQMSFCRGEKEMCRADCLFCSNWIHTLFLSSKRNFLSSLIYICINSNKAYHTASDKSWICAGPEVSTNTGHLWLLQEQVLYKKTDFLTS